MSSQISISHIDHALLAKGHPPRHLVHKFWARKPHNVVADYITSYSKEGEIVLDPFAGSGVTAIEAVILERKAIAIDLDPIATFITRMIMMPVDLEELKRAFKEIENKVKNEIEALYETRCSKCKEKAIILVTIWDAGKSIPTEIRFSCPCTKEERKTKLPDEEDKNRLSEIEKREIPYWYPKVKLNYPSEEEYKEGTHIEGMSNVFDLFTKGPKQIPFKNSIKRKD